MTEPIGRRIALHRRRRGLSQAAVAGLVGRSESWLSQVERGLRTVDSYTVLRDLARVLRVDISTLTGSGPTRGPGGAAVRGLAHRAGVRFVDPQWGQVGDPGPVQSGTGPDVVAAFDPEWVVAAVG